MLEYWTYLDFANLPCIPGIGYFEHKDTASGAYLLQVLDVPSDDIGFLGATKKL